MAAWVWQECHTLLICAHLCLSVGGFLCQKVLCVPRVLWEHSICLLCWCCRGSCTSVVVFSHGIHRWLGCVFAPNLCTSVPICGSFRRRVWHPAIPTPPAANSPTEFTEFTEVSGVVVFSHGFHGFPQMVRLRYWRRGYGRDAIPS